VVTNTAGTGEAREASNLPLPLVQQSLIVLQVILLGLTLGLRVIRAEPQGSPTTHAHHTEQLEECGQQLVVREAEPESKH
jgi:hypothetical protein